MSKTKMDDDYDALLKPLEINQEMLFLRLQSVYELSKKVVDKPELIDVFKARIRDLPSVRDKYDENLQEIISIKRSQSTKYVPSYKEIESFDQIYYTILSVDDRLVSKQLENSSRVKPRLPKLEIFHFDSKLDNWPTFRDTFSSLIHNSMDISNIEKFYYLLSSVSGPALTIVKSLPVTGDNYLLVWSALFKRYENKRALATAYLDKLFNFKPLPNECATGLNLFLQTFQENVKALKLLNIQDLASFILFYISLRNLDPTTRREFELNSKQGEVPDFDDLMNFIANHVNVLEMSDCKSNSSKTLNYNKGNQNKFNSIVSNSKPTYSNKFSSQQKTTLSSAVNLDTPNNSIKIRECSFCKKPHSIYKCLEYIELSPAQRLDKIKLLKLCENCLRDNHTLQDCPSKVRCTICKNMHHHTLHIDSGFRASSNSSSSFNGNAVSLTCSSDTTVLLGTAVIHVADSWGQYHSVRAIIDSGAMSSYITHECANRLRLTRRKCDFQPIGLGGNPVRDFGIITCTLKPRINDGPVLTTDAVIVNKIAGDLPTLQVSSSIIDTFQNLVLADPMFYRPAPIDILIAGDLFPYIYNGEKILPRVDGIPIAMNSIFGYVIVGQTAVRDVNNSAVADVTKVSTSDPDFCGFTMKIDRIMSSFWEVENIPSVKMQNPDDILADELFASNYRRDDAGRYIVKYPFRPAFELGDSRPAAVRRFANLESKLERQPLLKREYHNFMNEYESLGHMTRLGDMQNVDSKYIIPHFCIFKPSSTTTKLRVVFDASAKTTNNYSLNSVVLPGPKLQADLNQQLINFRLNEICLSADICKMYRQVLIDQPQREYQHILWRSSADQPVQIYQLNTVTYGVASSPYLAIKVLQTLADDEVERYPKASAVLKQAFFMDDFLWSVSTLQEATQLQDELMALLETGGFTLRKWSSNCAQVLQRLPAEHRETPVEFTDDQNLSIKVLGLQWLPASDSFSFSTSSTNPIVTKRTVLSQIGRLFDPLGFVAPCVFSAKCFMQKLWTQNLSWDQSLPAHLERQWLDFINELPLLSELRHERHVTVSNQTYSQILGFCDASSHGYAAVVYLRTSNDAGDMKVSLVAAKSKVAPLKTVSIPRLELMAAHLLSKLIKYIKSILQDRLLIHDTLLFTDSSVVLAWLNIPSYNLKTFVATRVVKILEAVSKLSWYHVCGAYNPADICSRGATPSALLATHEWLNGPKWLYTNQSSWPVKTIDEFKVDNPPELKPQPTLVSTENAKSADMLFQLTEKYSSFSKLVNIVARCLQFSQNCHLLKADRKNFSVANIRKAHDILIKSVQHQYFATDIAALSKGETCSQALRKLTPFIDSNGFLRVGGRLSQSELTYDKKHPLLLPKKSNFTKILIDHYHKIHLHVGPRTLQSIITQKYWIISARSAIRSRTVKCISCFKVSPSNRQPIMGELPKYRSQDIHVFHTVGIDIGGPFYTKESNRRNARISKSYLCVFVCCSIRAVHLEVLSSLSAECFLAAFDRFTARRGLCHTIISDNATNFVSAGKQLAEVSNFLKSNSNELNHEIVIRGVQWKHNPPAGSHFGGIYESAIKSAKLHLKRSLGTRALSFEELTTLFSRIEAVLNARPLCPLSNDPSEYAALTPSHFLIGRDSLSVPEYDLSDTSTTRLSRWQVVQQLAQQFWKRWRQEFLHTLQQRQKWFNNSRNLKIDDLVLLHSDAPPLQWHLARVTNLHPGPDGIVRVVTVRTKNSEFTRPVVKLSPLPMEQDSA